MLQSSSDFISTISFIFSHSTSTQSSLLHRSINVFSNQAKLYLIIFRLRISSHIDINNDTNTHAHRQKIFLVECFAISLLYYLILLLFVFFFLAFIFLEHFLFVLKWRKCLSNRNEAETKVSGSMTTDGNNANAKELSKCMRIVENAKKKKRTTTKRHTKRGICTSRITNTNVKKESTEQSCALTIWQQKKMH